MRLHIRAAFILFWFTAPAALIAQTCTITGPSNICLGDVATFSVSASHVPVSYQWDFGDGSSSVQPKPGYVYTAFASRVVSVVIKFANGDSCIATHNIQIHPLPVSSFSTNTNSIACISKNKICITDNSTPGPTGNPISKRVFLWDDGAGDNTTTPGAQKILCHTYLQTGKYVMVMETTDDKGCVAKTTRTVTILDDYKAFFNPQLSISPSDCRFRLCLYNATRPTDTANVTGYEWNFGDGTKNTTDYASACHDYDSNGLFKPYLVVKHKSGCVDTFFSSINIAKPDIKFNLQMKRRVCLGDTVSMFNDASNPFAQYRWFVKDSASGFEEPLADQTNPVNFTPLKPGKYYIKLNIYRDSCQKNGYDSIVVMCPQANFIMRNGRLCTDGDTTYFCDASCYYQSYNYVRLWDFTQGEQCTTDTKNGLNTTRNCRYSVDENPKHVFAFSDAARKTSCFDPKLFLKDTVTGCHTDATRKVLLGMPSFGNLEVKDTAGEYCLDLGTPNAQRYVVFRITGLSCNQQWDMYLNYDSAFDKTLFSKVVPNPPPSNLYKFTADTTGDVTIGFAVTNGDKNFYTSCTTAVPGQLCADTVWYHKKFNLMPVPNPVVSLYNNRGCAPFNFTVRLDDTTQYGVKKIVWLWGDGTADSLLPGPNDSIIPVKYHTYWRNGSYTVQVKMSNQRDCEEIQYLSVGLGYENFVVYDSVVCAGDSVQFTDVIYYFDKAEFLWRDSARAAQGKEQVWWDFDDGKGFVTKKYETKAFFAKEGTYHVRMATKDSINCRDTFEFTIYAVKADAHIRSMRDTFYCNDNIVRFYDSSYGSPKIPGDVPVQWQWYFGDGKNPSALQDPFHYYSSYGEKEVSLIVKSAAGCTDTAFKKLLFIGPEPTFEIVNDSIGCDPWTVEFKNTSGRVSTWIWYLGDPTGTTINTDRDTGIIHTYTPPGTYYVRLYGADSIYNPNTGNTYFCSAIYPDTPMVKKIIVLPYLKAAFTGPDTICQNTPVTFTNTSHPRYDQFHWWLGTGDSIFTDSQSIQYIYKKPGDYRIDFKPLFTPSDTERLCILDAFKNVTVLPILADFEINPNSLEPLFYFTNTSENAVRYEWDFGQPSSGSNNRSSLVHPSHNYKLQKGTYKVCLTAYNKEGCKDTVCKFVQNNYEPRLFIPNVFTPGGQDTTNHTFDIDIYRAEYYYLQIFNRWGEKVFETTEDGQNITDNRNWNGQKNNTGELCPPGVYFVVFDYEILGEDERKTYKGTLTLFRNN